MAGLGVSAAAAAAALSVPYAVSKVIFRGGQLAMRAARVYCVVVELPFWTFSAELDWLQVLEPLGASSAKVNFLGMEGKMHHQAVIVCRVSASAEELGLSTLDKAADLWRDGPKAIGANSEFVIYFTPKRFPLDRFIELLPAFMSTPCVTYPSFKSPVDADEMTRISIREQIVTRCRHTLTRKLEQDSGYSKGLSVPQGDLKDLRDYSIDTNILLKTKPTYAEEETDFLKCQHCSGLHFFTSYELYKSHLQQVHLVSTAHEPIHLY